MVRGVFSVDITGTPFHAGAGIACTASALTSSKCSATKASRGFSLSESWVRNCGRNLWNRGGNAAHARPCGKGVLSGK